MKTAQIFARKKASKTGSKGSAAKFEETLI